MHCSSLHLKVFAAILFVASNAINQACAQTSVQTGEETIQTLTPESPRAAVPSMYHGQKIVLVTSMEPTKKRACHVESASADEIRCQQHSRAQSVTYRTADLDAIIQPGPSPLRWLGLLVPFAIGGGIITGACFLGAVSAIALIGAIPIGLIGVFFALAVTLLVAYDGESATVLYQKPGTTLAVKLR